MLTQIGITEVNEASFTQGALDNSELISLRLPLSPGKTLTQTKTSIDLFNKSINSTLALDNNLDLKFTVLNAAIPSSPVVLDDFNTVDWSIKATNGKTIRNTIIRYRHTDIDRFTLESGNKVATHDNTFIENYIGTTKTENFDIYMYEDRTARIMSHRFAYLNQLGRAEVTVQTDLRFEDVEIGDVVQLEFTRLYKRFGDSASRKKLGNVVGKTVTGDQVTLVMSDLGNIFNTAAIITENSAADFSAASEDEKLLNGYITTVQGIVDDNEDTQNTNLIS